jgi:LPXTG-site transpeptidase (sortase) family protein
LSGAVISSAVTLGPLANEPTNDTDANPTNPAGEAPNAQSNRTVDFGFYRQQLGNLVFVDVNNNGTYDAGDSTLAGATVRLFASDGVTEINVGPDGIFGTADDAAGGVTTGVGGTYLFSGLPVGDYIVKLTPPTGYVSTVDTADLADSTNPDTNTDNNDNGIGTATGVVNSGVLTMTAGEVASNITVSNATGTTTDLTVDFGFVQVLPPSGLVKSLSGSNQTFTADPNVTIGEIITYQLSVTVPPGIYDNAQLVDTMDRGLSFVDCLGIVGNGLTTSIAGSFTSICSTPTVDDAGGGTTVDVDRRVTFSLGTLTNNTGSNKALVVNYRAVVLDSATNISGKDLHNTATFLWTGGNLGPSSTTVTVVEPHLVISKTASTTLISVGSEITIALEIQHDNNSETDASEALVTDILPAGMDFVPGSLECVSGAQNADTCTYNTITRTVTAIWDRFTLKGGNGRVTFRVRILTVPSTDISNTANVLWTSLPGVVNTPQNSNIFSTERDYDPASQVDVYGSSSTLQLNIFGTNTQSTQQLPATGFAPNVVTDLSSTPREVYSVKNDVSVEIPSLGINIPIVGVPLRNGEWNVSWLGNQAGWLEGSAFPSWNGNSVLTSHVYMANGKPGPFVSLSKLKYGDLVIVHAYGEKYTFVVQTNAVVSPNDKSIMKHEEKPWLTLITCKNYDEKTNSYLNRTVVRAILVNVSIDK